MIFLVADLLVRTSVLFVSHQRSLLGGAERLADQTAGSKNNCKSHAKRQGPLQGEDNQPVTGQTGLWRAEKSGHHGGLIVGLDRTNPAG